MKVLICQSNFLLGSGCSGFCKVRAKAEGVTVSDQAKYDAVMNAVGDDLKTFLLNINAEIKTQLDNLTAALQDGVNPPTGDTGCLYLILLVVLTAVLLNKKMVRIAKK